jgi:DNA-binding MarR family transcriptional regulator
MEQAIHAGHEFSANSEVAALIALRTDGALRARDLAALTGMTRAGTTNMIDRIVRAGLAQRGHVAEDRRGVLIELTRDGVASVDAMTDRLTEVFTHAAPWLADWGGHLDSMGFDVGPLRLPAGALHKRLDYVRHTTDIGPQMVPLYREAFGDDALKPHLLLHLLLLATEPGGTRPSLVSEEMLLSSASTSDLLGRAERDGLIIRSSGRPPDRRVVVVTAAERGVAALQTIVEGSGPVMRTLADIFFPS